VAEFFAGVRLDLGADEAVAAAREFAPDLMVNEMCDFIGPLVAATLEVPVATLAFGPAVPQEFLGAMTALAAPRYVERGLVAPVDWPSGRWVLDTCPPSLQFEGVRQAGERIALRPEPHRLTSQDSETGLEAGAGSSRPRVLVTFGTFFASPAVVGPLLNALAELDVELTATLGLDGMAEDYDVDPQRVELVTFVPMAQLLDTVSAVVTHGGAGTTLASLARGIPMLVIPQGADQFIQAERVAASGAGLALSPDRYSPAAAAEALSRLLAGPEFAKTAGRISDEIAAMSSPEEVAQRLEAVLA
jgi:hypothetical protein